MNKTVVVGVLGGIASYKALDIVSYLVKKGFNVKVMMSANALKFVSALTFKAISQNEVVTDLFSNDNSSSTIHIDLAKSDYFVIISATANFLAKLRVGICDDLITTTLLATESKCIIAPAMNTVMYNKEVNLENIEVLKNRGYEFIEPDRGILACGDYGIGKLANINRIKDRLDYFLNDSYPLKGKNICVSLGATKEYIDPVRYITNPSTGKMGTEIVKALRDKGANVYAVCTNKREQIHGVKYFYSDNVDEMFKQVKNIVDKMDIFISVAAVSDYKLKEIYDKKIEKTENLKLELTSTIDILKTISKDKGDLITIGFSAQTHDIFNKAKGKLKNKNLNAIILNDVSRKDIGFSSDDNEVYFITKDKNIHIKKDTKTNIALKIVELIDELLL